jgi:osmotically-inducible protein OsmY
MKLSKFAATVALFMLLPVLAAAKTAGERVDDTWIHTKVKAALVGHGGGDINIEVYHGHVQLAGFLNSEAEEEAALQAAANVEGVVKVMDQIYVVEPGRSAGRTLDDTTISAAVKAALAESDLERGLDVNVEVNRGVVLLSGWVDSTDERGTAITVAESVKNVVEVINGMDIKPAD